MSKSLYENMFFNNKIDLPPAQATSTPIRPKLQIVVIVEESSNGELENSPALAKSNRIDDAKKGCKSLLQLKTFFTESYDRVNFNPTLGNDEFEVNPLEKQIPSQDDMDRVS